MEQHTHPLNQLVNIKPQEIEPVLRNLNKENHFFENKPHQTEPVCVRVLLNLYRLKQPFRVAVGKSKWYWYEPENFNPAYNLREVLKDEIVFEFDDTTFTGTPDEFRELSWTAINEVAINLYKAGFSFEVWEHGGKSPHLHIHNLPIAHLAKDELREFKKFFVKKFCPVEYEPYVDYSLAGIHLLAIEGVKHWKGCYGVKELVYKFNPKEDFSQ